jgi:4-amino-4-deoxy-L-arabinose transferase-like glycosyltransferase
LARNRFAFALAAIAVVGLAVREFYVVHWLQGHRWGGDGIEFHLLAATLLDSHTYSEPFPWLAGQAKVPTAEKAPLYPVWLAAVSKAGITSFKGQALATGLLGTGTVVVTGLLGKRVGGVRVGLIAAAVAALYPMLFVLDGSMRAESLYVLLVASALLASYRLVERPTLWRAAVIGLLVAFAALTRGEGVFLLFVLGLPVIWLAARARRERWRLVAAMFAACALVLVPWLARNWIVFHQPTAISTNEGGLLAGANCDRAYHGELIGTWACFPLPPASWGNNESRNSERLRKQAFRYVGDHPGRAPVVAGVRLLRTWELWDPIDQAKLEAVISDRNEKVEFAALGCFYVLVLLAIGGGLLLRRRGRPLRVLLAPIVLVSVVGFLTYGSTRFRAAAEVPLVVLGAVALDAGAAALLARRRRSAESAVPA